MSQNLLNDQIFPASTFATHQEEIEFLAKLGFVTHGGAKLVKGSQKAFEEAKIIFESKEKSNIGIDGAVIKINDNKLVSTLGVVGKTPRGWCAIKFSAKTAITQIIGITWQTGRSGKVTPVADLEPVLLDGSKIKRATLHNYKEFLNKELSLKDKVLIHKAGDIIPEVIEVIKSDIKNDSFVAPDKCPDCQTKLNLSETEVDLVCPNIDTCPSQIIGRLSWFTSRKIGNITGLSEKNLQKLLEHKRFTEITGLYTFPFSEMINKPGFGLKTVENLKNEVEKSKNLKLDLFLAGLGIPGLGVQVSKVICQYLVNNSEFMKNIETGQISKNQNPNETPNTLF